MVFSLVSARHEKKEQAHRKNETLVSRFLALAQESTDVFWLLTAPGEMRELSSSWHTFTGQTERTCRGQGWLDALHPADQPQVRETICQCVTTGHSADIRCSLRRYDHTYRLIHLHVIPVHLSDGSIHEILLCGQDITTHTSPGDMSEAQTRLALEMAQVGMWDLDLLTDQLTWSEQRRALSGGVSETPVGHAGFLDSIFPEDREAVEQATQQSLASHTELLATYRVVWPDGSLHWLTERGRGIYDAQSKPVHLIGAVIDITASKQAEMAVRESEERFRRLVESNLIGITVADLEGTIYEANQAFLSLIGYTRQDLAAKRINWARLTPLEYHVLDTQAIEEIQKTGVVQPFEKEYLTKAGRRVPVLIGGTLVRRDDPSPLLLAFIVDLTARKEIEQQKDLLLSMTSHELKTPLTALKGTLQLLGRRMKRLSKHADQLPEAVRTFLAEGEKDLATSFRQIDVQTRLINDLLDVSRITSNTLKLSLHRCDLARLVREIVEDLRAMALDRLLVLDLPEQESMTVLADRDRISQVIMNYVTNALRYSPSNQPVHIGGAVEQDRARIWVRDRGPGLSEEKQKELWQRFHQIKGVPKLSGSGKGLGLGLYICCTLIAQHHGAVGVDSALGEGSTFWFTLPLIAGEEHEKRSHVPRSRGKSQQP